jgi:hypothetical protein
MTIYKRQPRQPFRFLLAAIIFMIILGFTTTDLCGLNLQPLTPSKSSSTNGNSPQSFFPSHNLTEYMYPSDEPSYAPEEPAVPAAVPEPSILLLFGTGLAALSFLRRK